MYYYSFCSLVESGQPSQSLEELPSSRRGSPFSGILENSENVK